MPARNDGADSPTLPGKETSMRILRRQLLAFGASVPVGVALDMAAQTLPRIPRVAYVWLFGHGPSAPYPGSFNARMAELGWINGSNVVLEPRDANGSASQLDAIMQDLVRSKVDVIVAMCTPEAVAAKKATTTIPIVVAATGDPVKAGLVESMARPGGNITGISGMMLEMSARRVALLKEAFPKLTQATVLWNPGRPDNHPEVKTMQDAGGRIGITVRSAQARTRDELAVQLDAMGWDKTQSILNAGDSLLGSEIQSIVNQAARLRVPGMYEDRDFVKAGGLMSYGPNFRDMHRRAADYVDKVLKGAKPGDIPFEQPTKFELVVNKNAARALGVIIPNSILLQADEVIG